MSLSNFFQILAFVVLAYGLIDSVFSGGSQVEYMASYGVIAVVCALASIASAIQGLKRPG